MKETPLPLSLRLAVFFLFTTQNIGNTMIPVFIGYMVYSFLEDQFDDKDINIKVAYYTGLIEANYKLMSFIGSFLWGYVSDHISRKSTLLLVLIGNILSYLLLGLSVNYSMAFFARAIAGLCAGIVPITKATMKDMTDKTNYPKLFSYCGMGTGFGSLLGPLIGGLLSNPCFAYPSKFSCSYLSLFPYLFPNIFYILSVFICITLVKISIKPIQTKSVTPEKTEIFKELIMNKNFFLSVFCYGLIAAAQLGFRVLLALWVKTPQDLGGIGWTTTKTLGLVQSIGALIIIGFSYIAVPWFSLKFGNLISCALFSGFLCPLIFLCPFTRDFDYIWLLVFMTMIYGFVMAFFTSYISLISIEISNSVSPSIVGSANGLSQGLVALFSASASATVGGIYGWTLAINSSFPFDCHFTFIVLCGIILICIFITLWPRKSKPEVPNEFKNIIESQEVSVVESKN
ncbi:hypothetical protein SteCoe_24968 [Stentor coeruleus]|uniref:Major facilitator superfamily (MFS) profile domain-containing protein n=1 Tax=Stentor coeruleus TaxID=5963 RepID=A0A1R2BGB7_9CILI|nr:hypothetical protein SteCoe_24968 [Stentor coeruleus]